MKEQVFKKARIAGCSAGVGERSLMQSASESIRLVGESEARSS